MTSELAGRPAGRVRWATFALWIVRVGIVAWVIGVGLALVGVSDRALGDRLSLQEYGFGYPNPTNPKGKPIEHNGPWLVLAADTSRRFCPQLNRPYDASDPAQASVYGRGACQISKAVRAGFGDVDVDGLRLVRQIEGPPDRVESGMTRVLFAGYAFFLLAAVSLERILRLTSRGRPFSKGAVRWLRALAVGGAGVLIVVPYFTDRFIDGLVREYFTADGVAEAGIGTSFNLGAVFGIVLILVIAEVWRAGINLQDDVEATV
ncbi:MAG: DUF2975 domain-containing protein [Solirubrobacteraceae bacterium]|nr:DUF2975 domain-containing protein [Solirubrobacteraceae bacterium]